LPFIGSWLAFYVFEVKPDSRNYGDLVVPARPLKLQDLQTTKKLTLNKEFWKKWTFVIIDDGQCERLCQDNLYYLRQMRIALGRDVDRVQNLLLTSASIVPGVTEFLGDYPDLSVVEHSPAAFINQFEIVENPGISKPFVYLVDPLGNLMMTYPGNNDPSSILSDMRRLLKVSQVG
jgi:cytochrome oxidase Cu insertion factor (SCO1/SenC/PrrC family)